MRLRAHPWPVLGIWMLAAGASAAERVELSKAVDTQHFKTGARVEVRNMTLGFWPANGRVLGDPRQKDRQLGIDGGFSSS